MSKIIPNIKDIYEILVSNFKTHDTPIHKMHLQVFEYFLHQLYFHSAFRLSVTKWSLLALTSSHPRFLFSACTRVRVHRVQRWLSLSLSLSLPLSLFLSRSCPFPLASLLFQVHATQLAIYVGYLCNGSSWLSARSTNTGIACTRQSHTKPDRNLYTALSATN